jgi:two-component system, NtrC family, sensor kinase
MCALPTPLRPIRRVQSRKLPPPSPSAEEASVAARQSSEGVEQVAGIVRAMKEFSHPMSMEMAPLDLNRVIERATMVCRNEWKHCAELRLSLDDRLPQVPGLEGEMNQVVLNLVVNAAHAIVEAGRGQGRITIATSVKDGKAVLSVADTGTGIPVDLGMRIFEPFFTTKDVGKGTGQGLAIAHDIIVNRHGGTLDFESRDDEGTTFSITLPLDGANTIAPEAQSQAEVA